MGWPDDLVICRLNCAADTALKTAVPANGSKAAEATRQPGNPAILNKYTTA